MLFPTHVGMDRRGPQWSAWYRMVTCSPTHVGMDRQLSPQSATTSTLFPTHVGMDREVAPVHCQNGLRLFPTHVGMDRLKSLVIGNS